jgi:hypothetical protein
MRACCARTRFKVRLAGILVGELGLLRHELRVLTCGLGQRGIPLQRRQSLLRPIGISQIHQLLLSRLLR